MTAATLRELLEILRSTTPFGDEIRGLIAAIEQIDDEPSTIHAALTVARGSWRTMLLETLTRTHVRTLMSVLLPGLTVGRLVVRTIRPHRFVEGWQGDLHVHPVDDLSKVTVIVGSLRGALALQTMERSTRARIGSLSVFPLEGESEHAIEAVLCELMFDGVTAIAARDPARAIGMVVRCPSLTSFSGPLTRDIAEALLTSAITEVWPGEIETGALAVLARAPFLTKLGVGIEGRDELASLVEFPALTELHVYGGWLEDADLLGRIVGLERLMMPNHPISNAARLENLIRLRALDLHETQIGDSTMLALSRLPALVELDVLGTPISIFGVGMFQSSSLQRIGLAWHEVELINAARNAGLNVVTDSEEGLSMGGAIWASAVPGN